MSLCVETLKIEDGHLPAPEVLEYHRRRMERTRQALWPDAPPAPELSSFLRFPADRKEGVLRCRILYGPQGVEQVEYLPYTPVAIRTLLAVSGEGIDYSYKYADRTALTGLKEQALAAGCDEALIVMPGGRVTDTTICNVAFLPAGALPENPATAWHTPARPLLPGTTRARLLDSGHLQPRDLTLEEVVEDGTYSHIALFNAFNPLGSILLPISAIRVG